MTITPHAFLTLHYRLSSATGQDIINTFDGTPATLTLGTGQLAPLLESYLVGLEDQAHQVFEIPAQNNPFGQRQATMLQWVSRELLKTFGDQDETYAVGDVVQFPTPDGQATYAGAVQEVRTDAVKFDFNHPLAGQALRFEVKILGVL